MKNTLKVLGATNLSVDQERSKNDYYGTDPRSTEALLQAETFDKNIWEPCAGHHLIVDKLKEHGYNVYASDIAEYEGYEHAIHDFINEDFSKDFIWTGDIITNPPYNLSTDFTVKALDVLQPGHKLAMFLRLQYLEGATRYNKVFKENPPKTVYVFTNRQTSSKVDDFTTGSAIAYCWYVWEKGYKGDTTIKWLATK